jgi:rhodanese-related sulfurtransferase
MENKQDNSPTITREELKNWLDQHYPFVLIESLSEEQYRQGHLPSAINLPPEKVKEMAPNLLRDKHQQIVVYCASSTCEASEHTARTLAEMGYENVLRYVEGKKDWSEAGLPLEGGECKAA